MTSAILDVRLAAPPGIVLAKGANSDLVHLFALDRLPVDRQPPVCRWRRNADGRLACIWKPDIGASPQR